MRENLFKAKRVDGGKWIEGYLFKSWGRAFILWGTTNGVPDSIEVDPETVCQFTNYVDMNGVKVFEDDLWERNGFVGVVKYRFGGWQIDKRETSNSYQYPAFHSNIGTGKIIGNIHGKKEGV